MASSAPHAQQVWKPRTMPLQCTETVTIDDDDDDVLCEEGKVVSSPKRSRARKNRAARAKRRAEELSQHDMARQNTKVFKGNEKHEKEMPKDEDTHDASQSYNEKLLMRQQAIKDSLDALNVTDSFAGETLRASCDAEQACALLAPSDEAVQPDVDTKSQNDALEHANMDTLATQTLMQVPRNDTEALAGGKLRASDGEAVLEQAIAPSTPSDEAGQVVARAPFQPSTQLQHAATCTKVETKSQNALEHARKDTLSAHALMQNATNVTETFAGGKLRASVNGAVLEQVIALQSPSDEAGPVAGTLYTPNLQMQHAALAVTETFAGEKLQASMNDAVLEQPNAQSTPSEKEKNATLSKKENLPTLARVPLRDSYNDSSTKCEKPEGQVYSILPEEEVNDEACLVAGSPYKPNLQMQHAAQELRTSLNDAVLEQVNAHMTPSGEACLVAGSLSKPNLQMQHAAPDVTHAADISGGHPQICDYDGQQQNYFPDVLEAPFVNTDGQYVLLQDLLRLQRFEPKAISHDYIQQAMHASSQLEKVNQENENLKDSLKAKEMLLDNLKTMYEDLRNDLEMEVSTSAKLRKTNEELSTKVWQLSECKSELNEQLKAEAVEKGISDELIEHLSKELSVCHMSRWTQNQVELLEQALTSSNSNFEELAQTEAAKIKSMQHRHETQASSSQKKYALSEELLMEKLADSEADAEFFESDALLCRQMHQEFLEEQQALIQASCLK